ncbi:FtsX-like permease family protein [Cellulomonas sp. 179-A 9B4 NHS]|uniref:FtsX-like permease family protein n=1 Tax=Cellulomonas sp. 179-A 9B4 NHS TaxID=3142379 RepID=UPI0039A10A75
MGWRWRVLVRRLRDQSSVIATVVAVTLVATTLLGTFALLLQGSAGDALAEALDRAPADDVRLEAVVRVSGKDADVALATARDALRGLHAGVEADEETWLTGSTWILPGRGASGAAPYGYPASSPRVPGDARLLTGTWPDRARDDAGRLLVAVPAVAADEYGWAVGTEVPVRSQGGQRTDTWLVTGTHELTGRPGTWTRDRIDGRGHDPQFVVPGSMGRLVTDLWGPMVVGPGGLAGSGVVDVAHVVSEVRLGDAPPEALAHLRAAVDDAQVALTAGLRPTGMGGTVRTTVGDAIDAAWRELSVTRVGVVVVGLLLTVLATTVMLLAARLLGERRSAEGELLAARGAAPRQLRSLAVLEAVALALVCGAAAPWLARALWSVVVAGGPLERAGFTVPPGVPLLASATCAVVAFVLAVALVVPQWHVAGSSAPAAHAGLVRTGADLGLVALAGVALWQLLTYGSPLTVGPTGPRLDPVLAVGPALVTLGAAVLALRLVGPVGRGADALAARSRALVGPLAAWQVARRPAAASGTTLVLVLAVAAATFGQSFLATWRVSQLEQVDLALGTDVRVHDLSGERVLGSAALTGPLDDATGATAQPVVDRSATLGRALTADIGVPGSSSSMPVHLVGVDTTRPEALRGRTDVPWAQVVSDLAPRGAERPVPLPGDPQWVVADVTAGVTPAAPGSGTLTLVVEDRHGVRTALDAPLPLLDEATTVVLEVPALAGPARVVAVSGRISLALAPPRPEGQEESRETFGFGTVRVTSARVVDRAAAVDADGAATAAATPLPLADGGWEGFTYSGTSRYTLGVTGDADALQLTGEMNLTAIVNGSGRLGAVAWQTGGGPVPVVVTEAAAREGVLGPGDDLALTLGSTSVDAEVERVVPYLPGAPRGPGVLADRGRLGRALLEQGSTDPLVDAWWVAAQPGGDGVALGAALDATGVGDVAVRTTQRQVATEGPLRVGVPVALSLVALAAAALVVVGLGTSTTVAVRTRRLELARLQALGAARGGLVRGLLVEHLLLVGLGTVAGLAIGWGVAATVAPLLTVSGDGRRPVPGPLLVWPWLGQLGVAATLAAAACLVVAVVAALLVRRASGALLRLGDDR